MKTIVKKFINNFSGNPLDLAPTTLNVELTNICNLDCVMCPAYHVKRPKGYMDLQTFQDLLPEAVDLGVKQIGLFTTGESILHRQVGDFVRAAKETGLYIYMDINGNFIRQGVHEELVEAGLDSLKFGIDAPNQEIYSQVRRGGEFDKVLENLKKFDRVRKEFRSNMKLYALFIINALNQDCIDDFKEIFAPCVDEIEVSLILNQGEQFEGCDELVSPHLHDLMRRYRKRRPCINPFKRITISWDGYLTACCIDFELQLSYAKYEKGKLEEAWHNTKITELRHMMEINDHNLLPSICKNCDMTNYDIENLIIELNKIY